MPASPCAPKTDREAVIIASSEIFAQSNEGPVSVLEGNTQASDVMMTPVRDFQCPYPRRRIVKT